MTGCLETSLEKKYILIKIYMYTMQNDAETNIRSERKLNCYLAVYYTSH